MSALASSRVLMLLKCTTAFTLPVVYVQVISIDLRSNLSHGIGVKCRKDESQNDEDSHQMATEAGQSLDQQIPKAHDSNTEPDEIRYVYILNRVLPAEIRVLAWCPVDPAFSARFSCTSRTYKYFFPHGNLDLSRMLQAARALIGEHDFRNLCKMDVGNGVVTYHRCITAVDLAICRHESRTCHMKTETTGSVPDDSVNSFSSQEHAEPDLIVNKAVENTPHIDGGFDDSYEICELTITGQAFLWHQIRCIVAVLFLIGQGRENPSVISELLDVECHPCKPQYTMAAEFPLVLYDCAYDNDDIAWQYDADSSTDTVRSMQAVWTQHSVRAAMLRRMLSELGRSGQHQTDCLVPGTRSRTYKPLFERERCESLEDRIGHYAKKQKLALTDTQLADNSNTL